MPKLKPSPDLVRYLAGCGDLRVIVVRTGTMGVLIQPIYARIYSPVPFLINDIHVRPLIINNDFGPPISLN